MKFQASDKKIVIIASAVIFAFVAVFSAFAVIFFSDEDKPESPPSQTDTSAALISDMNGVWIASVMNINFPSAPDLTMEELIGEIDAIIDTTARAGLDSIFFQVRPCGDALYESEIFPVSKYLSSKGELTLDCLDYMITKAREYDIDVHAWINPLRISVSGTFEDLSPDSPVRLDPSLGVLHGDGRIYLDCGLPEARELIARGIREIVENYDVKGIIFDDYFYPYPYYETDGEGEKVLVEFDDSASYDKYGAAFDDIGDWRRDNVNKMVKSSYDAAKKANAECLFGVAPFGIWKNGFGDESGSETLGAQSYYDIYCDTLAWVEGGYVDYIAPQIYWNDEELVASYSVICDWWARMLADTDVALLITHGIYRYDDWESPEGIMTAQVEYAREKENYRGSLFYGYEVIRLNSFGALDELSALYND